MPYYASEINAKKVISGWNRSNNCIVASGNNAGSGTSR